MRRALPLLLSALLPLLLGPAPAAAIGAEASLEEAAEHEGEEEGSYGDVIMHHISDGYDVELPWFNGHLGVQVDLHEVLGVWCLGETHEGPHGVACDGIDLTPTRMTLFMWLAAILVFVLFTFYGRRKYDENGVPQGMNNLLESLVLFVRDELAIANIGKEHGPRYVPLLLTIFFFILTMNLLGLVPYGATATGSLMVTGSLALVAFLFTQLAGMRSHGYVKYWVHLVPSGVPGPLWLIMWPIEFIGLFTKPFALMIRLFANMTAGHVIILSLLGLIFMLKTAAMGFLSVPFALFIYLLELFVAFLQAYVFTMLTALFIGLASHSH